MVAACPSPAGTAEAPSRPIHRCSPFPSHHSKHMCHQTGSLRFAQRIVRTTYEQPSSPSSSSRLIRRSGLTAYTAHAVVLTPPPTLATRVSRHGRHLISATHLDDATLQTVADTIGISVLVAAAWRRKPNADSSPRSATEICAIRLRARRTYDPAAEARLNGLAR